MFRNYFIRQMLLISPTQQTSCWSCFWPEDSTPKGVPAPRSQWAVPVPPGGGSILQEMKGNVKFAGEGLGLSLCPAPSD